MRVDELDPLGREVLHLHHLRPPALAQVHDRAGVLGRGEDGGRQHRLVDVVELARLGQLARIVHVDLGPVGQVGPVGHRRGGGDEREVELPLEPLADDLHVQQPEEPAAEPEAERARRLGLVGEAGVVEPQLLQGVAQVGQLVAVDREQPAEDHRLRVAVAGQGLGGRVGGGGHRLAGAGPADVLDAGDQVADLAGAELVDRDGDRRPDADLLDLVVAAGLHEPEPVGAGAASPPSPGSSSPPPGTGRRRSRR